MTKEQLFTKYNIDKGHEVWENHIDNWYSIEIYREMHGGELPPPDDFSIAYVLDFLDKTKDPKYFFSLKNAGSYYTTAKRMVYRHADAILKELEKREANNGK